MGRSGGACAKIRKAERGQSEGRARERARARVRARARDKSEGKARTVRGRERERQSAVQRAMDSEQWAVSSKVLCHG